LTPTSWRIGIRDRSVRSSCDISALSAKKAEIVNVRDLARDLEVATGRLLHPIGDRRSVCIESTEWMAIAVPPTRTG